MITPRAVALQPDIIMLNSLSSARAGLDVLYVVDADWRLLDDIELRRVILAALTRGRPCPPKT